MHSATPRIDARPDDDAEFVEYANRLLAGLVTRCSAARVLVTRVQGWFDDKWLGFSGKTLGAAGVHDDPPRVPPFVSNRLASNDLWRRIGEHWARESAEESVYHSGRAAENLYEGRRFDTVLPDTTGIWISTASAADPHAAIMVYASHHAELTPFYLSVQVEKDVRPLRLKGISEQALAQLVRHPPD